MIARSVLAALWAALFAFLAPPTHAISLERLIMPGPVIAGHAKYEDACGRCHEPFSKAQQRRLCLDCHEAIAADIRSKRGHHGRAAGIAGAECKECHGDHKGRDADIVGLDPDTFDHRATDYPLTGAHGRVPCRDCHAGDAKRRDAPSECRQCHAGTDPHFGRMGPACQDCHGVETWKNARFDHDKTRFRLVDKHRPVPCEDCHPGARYKPTPTDCHSCHRLDDAHGGRFGTDCGACHGSDDWRKASFDHDKRTDFPLVGRHREAACGACHKDRLDAAKPTRICVACHRGDDAHAGRNGSKCDTCHTEDGWSKSRFDHGRDTKFRLLGKHGRVSCAACHKAPADQEKPGKTCDACHLPDDVHRGLNGPKCETCHAVQGWRPAKFDHDKDTRFVLRGRHAEALCRACHTAPVHTAKPSQDCFACHRGDDVHKGQQGAQCARCHNEAGWGQKVFFDHDLTDFPLIGLHAIAPCEECHLDATFQISQGTCTACHREDDVHEDRLGSTCERCHNPNGWDLWNFDHNTRTDFALDGAHDGLECLACHEKPVESDASLPADCFGCHRDDDTHRGGFGRFCQRCHVTRSFSEVRLAQ